jgi:very-short-patch-repair endonuclease
VDLDLPPVLRRPDLLDAGWTDRELRRRRRSGQLHAVARGSYLHGGDERLDDAVRLHALRVRACSPLLSSDAVVSHVSAAVLHGLAVWGVPLDRVHHTRDRSTGGRRTATRHLHTAPLEPVDVTAVAGTVATSAARTLDDLARTVAFAPAVAVVDDALHRELVEPQALLDVLVRTTGWRGAPDARRAIAFADGRSMSVGESRSRVAMARLGLPVPELQFPIAGSYVDFAWPELRVVGEFDGRVKYGKHLRPGEEPGDAVFAEKVREDRIRDEGWRVVRWTWGELADFRPVAQRLQRAFAAR